jgi:PAS domain S-box/diguanylate cyclase (GGDEF) domain
MNTPRYFKPFLIAVVAAGTAALAFSATRLTAEQLDWRFVLLVASMATVASRLSIPIPYVKGQVTVGDTIVFLTLMFYGGEAAVVVAAVDGLSSSLYVSRKPRVWLFNSSQMALSTFITVWVLRYLFGNIRDLDAAGFSLVYFGAICVMFFVQYATNSGLVATYTALKTNQPILLTWRTSYLWTSISYLAGASVAGVSERYLKGVSIYAILLLAPVIAIIYITYKTYLRNIESSIAQATEAKHHAELLEASEERFRSAFDCASIGMALVCEEGRWLQVNRALCQLLGYAEEELLTKDIQFLTHPEDFSDLQFQQSRVMEGKISRFETEKRFVHKRGHEVWTLSSVSPVRDPETKRLRLIFQIQDITDRKRAEAQLVHDAFHDALTGLPNRSLLVDHLKLAIARSARHRDVFSVLFLDLDRFKVVNDSLGHLVGDQLLIGVARRMEKCLRPGDTIARLGGDEFTILLEGLISQNEAICIAERLQSELRVPFEVQGHQVFTSASIGIAPSAIGYSRPEDILRDADTAMYSAKARGGCCYDVFDKTMHARAVETLEMQNDLRQAIERHEFAIFYQPIVSLDTFNVQGFEALLRWKNPRYGMISPGRFIPMAEENGLIVPIGEWVLRTACAQAKQWQEQYSRSEPITMSVNISSKQLDREDLVSLIQEVLRETKLDPGTLKLEITESAVVHNVAAASETLKQIRMLGVSVSMDDFGTGYSSLSMLHQFPISTLKIDGSFVSRMTGENENTEIIRTILSLAQNFRMDVVAEGVETLDQVTKLRSFGCEAGQGYFFSRPLPVEEAGALLVQTQANLSCYYGDNVESLLPRLVA